jgi:hypothetical protein
LNSTAHTGPVFDAQRRGISDRARQHQAAWNNFDDALQLGRFSRILNISLAGQHDFF